MCPVAAVLSYLMVRGTALGPLFVYQDGQKLTHQRFSEAVRGALASAEIDHSKYFTHSFHIGAATTAAAKGLKMQLLKH